MTEHSYNIVSIKNNDTPGRPLAPWTYSSAEVFELEYEALFLRRWQFAGHLSDVAHEGDYLTADIGRDSVIVIRGKDGELRAFLNVCRHRASRILEASGTCHGVIRCPYHGWTYRLDGSLMATPQEEGFPNLDRARHGLHRVQLEVFHGLVFVRVKGEGPSVAEQFGYTASFFEKYGVADYEQCAESSTQIWNVNWKVAWDNYLENYHIPIGHPGLHRLLIEDDEWDELSSGVGYGVFRLKNMPSSDDDERRYQEYFHFGEQRVPADLAGKWVQLGYAPNLGIDFYPEMVDLFQVIPLGPDKSLIRATYYGHRDPSPEEIELRRLNIIINDKVNDEDRTLCSRVQLGLRTHGYQPGPLSQKEWGVYQFHEMLRGLVPVLSLAEAPDPGTAAAVNAQMTLQESVKVASPASRSQKG